MSDDEAVPAPSGKVDASTKAADTAHHYAWNATTAARAKELAELGVRTAPTPLSGGGGGGDGASAPSPLASAPSPLGSGSASASGRAAGSAWNTAGTWEAKEVSAKAKALMSSHFSGRILPLPAAAGAPALCVRVTAVPHCEGSVSLVFSRGKAKPGFELAVRLDVEVLGAGADAADAAAIGSGTLHFTDVSDSEGSDIWGSWRVDVASFDTVAAVGAGGGAPLASREALAALLRARADVFRGLFAEWVEGVKGL